MIASVLLAVALGQPVPVQSTSAQLGVSLRIVDPCDPAVASAQACTPAAWDQWLQAHSKREIVTEDGKRILEIEF